MGGAVSAGEDNDELIDNLVEAEYIKTPMVEQVFRAVDRANYYADGCKENAYRDLAWKHGNLHLSAPCIYSEVMEYLQLVPGLSFLNLGSGTGYLSTMVGLVLGPYGINHGVEIHKDVVEYANSKLEEFKSMSSALDEYEFCPPSFITGNCLLLDNSTHQYDRVYCGASCPQEHENYMKNLIRVGGILVMPLNDHLFQVIRTSETTWEMKSILPVSFASLILPSPSETLDSVTLPDSSPLSLQEICRSAIRVLLRRNIDIENPTLKNRKRRNPRKKRQHQCVKRIVIPLFEENFDGPFSRQDDDSDNEFTPQMHASSSPNEAFEPDGSIGYYANGTENGMHFDGTYTNMTKAYVGRCSSNDTLIQHGNTPDEEKPCVSSVELKGKENGSFSGNVFSENCPSDIEMSDIESKTYEGTPLQCLGSRKAGTGDEDCDDDDDDDDDDDGSGSLLEHSLPRTDSNKVHRKQTAAVIFKHVALDDVDSEDSHSSKDEGVFSSKLEEDMQDVAEAQNSYTYFMKQKISALPLPLTLKSYLNYLRPV